MEPQLTEKLKGGTTSITESLSKLGDDVIKNGKTFFSFLGKLFEGAFESIKEKGLIASLMGAVNGYLDSMSKSEKKTEKKDGIPKISEKKPDDNAAQARAGLRAEVGPAEPMPMSKPTTEPIKEKKEEAEKPDPKDQQCHKPSKNYETRYAPESIAEPLWKPELQTREKFKIKSGERVQNVLPPDLYKEIQSQIKDVYGTPKALEIVAKLFSAYYVIGAYCGHWVSLVYEMAGMSHLWQKHRSFNCMKEYPKSARQCDEDLFSKLTAKYIAKKYSPEQAEQMAIADLNRNLKFGDYIGIFSKYSPDPWKSHGEVCLSDPKDGKIIVAGYPGSGERPYVKKKYIIPHGKGSDYKHIVRVYSQKPFNWMRG